MKPIFVEKHGSDFLVAGGMADGMCNSIRFGRIYSQHISTGKEQKTQSRSRPPPELSLAESMPTCTAEISVNRIGQIGRLSPNFATGRGKIHRLDRPKSPIVDPNRSSSERRYSGSRERSCAITDLSSAPLEVRCRDAERGVA